MSENKKDVEKELQDDIQEKEATSTEQTVDIEQALDIMEPNINIPEEMTYAEFEAILKHECAECIDGKSEEEIERLIYDLYNSGVGIPMAKKKLCEA